MEPTQSKAAVDAFLGVTEPGRFARHRGRILAAGGVLLLAGVLYALFGRGDPAPRYATEEIERGDLKVTVSATGNLAPTNEVEVGSELSGLVETVYVDVNDRVTRGQPIAKLDTLRLNDAIARSEATLQQARAGVGQAEATLRQSKASLARFEEVSRLSEGKVPSAVEMDVARADYDRALANVAAARAQVASAEAQLSSDRVNLGKATIRSPVTGVVLSRQIEPGQTVAASFNTPTLFRIAEDLSSMKLEVKVDEADVGQVKAGQPATFTVDAFPDREFPAVIRRVNVGANTAASSSSSSSSGGGSSSSVIAYTAVLTVKNDDLLLQPDMTATAEIVTQEEKGVLLVPNSALRYKPASADDAKKRSAFPFAGGPPGRMMPRPAKNAKVKRGAQRTLYVLSPEGTPAPLEVTVGASNGSLTSVTGKDVAPGLRVITSELASQK